MTENKTLNNNWLKKLFDLEVELLPSVSELFELELAYMEYQTLDTKELIQRSAYLKSINSTQTLHYLSNTFKKSFDISSRAKKTKSYFESGVFSTGYATHSLFPYRGKFHPQLIKALLNIIGIKKGEIVLDPMCGSGTTNIEAALLGINSVAIDISPFCRLMTKTKYESLKANKEQLLNLLKKKNVLFDFFSTIKKLDFKDKLNLFENEIDYYLSLLAFLDALGYFDRTKSLTHQELFFRVIERYIFTLLNYLENPFYDKDNLGKLSISKESTAMNIKFEDNTFDGIITSPPYSFAIDYVSNDKSQLEYLGIDLEKLKEKTIGLRGRNKTERLDNYFKDMKIVCAEISRVLKPNKFAVIIIGSNTNQTGGVRLEDRIIKFCEDVNLKLVKNIVKPIKGLRNTMKEEYILFLKKLV